LTISETLTVRAGAQAHRRTAMAAVGSRDNPGSRNPGADEQSGATHPTKPSPIKNVARLHVTVQHRATMYVPVGFLPPPLSVLLSEVATARPAPAVSSVLSNPLNAFKSV